MHPSFAEVEVGFVQNNLHTADTSAEGTCTKIATEI